MKYIRTEVLGIVLFSKRRSHDDMANRMMSPGDELISAGFANVDDWSIDGVYCHGSSTTLNLSSNVEDTEILRGMLRR